MAALLNPKVWIAAAAAVALALAGFFLYRAGRASLRGEFDAYKLAQQEARILADKAQRTEEQRRVAAITKGVEDAQPVFRAEARDAAALPDSRLQQPAIRYIQRACPNSASAPAGPAAPDPLVVFADVFGRLERRSEDLARLAGERGAAGALCERSYDALTPSATPAPGQ